ncbi:MAG: GrpB family protein [Clostridia bacterium]|nr:GrpB family protein [Clostridia bacterium]
MARQEIVLSRHAAYWENDAKLTILALRDKLGDLAPAIQHIGSTAVRGILAVPVIDIAIGLADATLAPTVMKRLGEMGYRRIPTDATGCIRMAKQKKSTGADSHRLWITLEGCQAWCDLITFRNYLYNHVFMANEYEQLKLRLQPLYQNDPIGYSHAKSEFIQKTLRLSTTDRFLGKRLTIMVDRPAGSTHPDHPDIRYPINYGYVPGILSPDGEEMDAYVYGVSKPLHRFTGTVIAAVHRRDDAEDKLVVAPTGMMAYEPQIAEAVRFAEQYFDTTLVCIYEKSCGAIVYRTRDDGVIEYLVLYQHRSGTWSLPKGHIAAGETEEETALREVWEETGLKVSLQNGFRREMSYTVSAKALKHVVFFLARAQGELTLGENEISDYIWAEKSAAIRRLGGRNMGKVVEAAEAFIRGGRQSRRRYPFKRNG